MSRTSLENQQQINARTMREKAMNKLNYNFQAKTQMETQSFQHRQEQELENDAKIDVDPGRLQIKKNGAPKGRQGNL